MVILANHGNRVKLKQQISVTGSEIEHYFKCLKLKFFRIFFASPYSKIF
jgi:hypothetical protein